jgi:DNA polymerase
MKGKESAAQYVPAEPHGLRELWEAAQRCEGCPLFRNATQAVLGEGPAKARLVLVGEQPGDKEDLAGRPFVGPAGKLLDRALEEAELNRAETYVTNAVKHFKFEERGKRRIHKKPRMSEITACRPWLDAELAILRPELVVCLGATAAQGLLGSAFRLTGQRGMLFEHPQAGRVMATVHPSAILRVRDGNEREQSYRELVEDLRRAKRYLSERAA